MKEVFLISYTTGAAVLALWVHVRWPHAPSLRALGAHILAALVLLNVPTPGPETVALTLVFLVLTYAFLVAVWGLEVMRGAMLR